MAAQKLAREQKPTPSAKLPIVAHDEFKKTLQHLCRVGGERLELINHLLSAEEEGTPSRSWRVERDNIYPYRSFMRREERKLENYNDTTWLFVLLHVHGLKIEDRVAVIFDTKVHIAYHYMDGWGMDKFSLMCHLLAKKHADLASLTDRCRKVGDVCWLVWEAARRDREPSLTYWLICLRLYNGPPSKQPSLSLFSSSLLLRL